MKVLSKTRLRIRDQNELLNQIAGTYKDFYRAAMEYVDNAIDAAEIQRRSGNSMAFELKIGIDTKNKTITFTDNCGGMSPQELCELLNQVGKSKKKTVPWANGQFGFGVHAFRAFAKQAIFTSNKSGEQEAQILIDKSYDENKEVDCVATNGKVIKHFGTRVEILKFNQHVFKKGEFFNCLVSEIEHHFDDVLRNDLITILLSLDGSKNYRCRYFDYSELEGETLKKTIDVDGKNRTHRIVIDLKFLSKSQENRLPIITNKRRRIQSIIDLKSYKNFLRMKGSSNSVWSNPFIVGSVEIDDLCSPNLTRDDLIDSNERESLYEALLEAQIELEDMVDSMMHKKAHESYKKLGNMMSDCLSSILKNFKLRFDRVIPSPQNGAGLETLADIEGEIKYGGSGKGGGASNPSTQTEPNPDDIIHDDDPKIQDNGNSGGDGNISKGKVEGKSNERLQSAAGPKIEFGNHSGENRVIDLEHSLIVNTQHADFIQRNKGGNKKIILDARLLNYVSMVVSPYCVHRMFEKKGKIATPLEIGDNVVELSTKLENALFKVMGGQTLEM